MTACALAVCVVPIGVAAQSAETVSLYAEAKPYMDNPLPTLKTKVTDLDGLKADTNQDELPTLLNKAGEVILAQMPRVPNLIAREDIALETKASSSYAGNKTLMLQGITPDGTMIPQEWRHFEFLIIAKHQTEGGVIFEESRKEIGKVHPAALPRGVGFSSLWLMFLPSNVPDSHFRYLGKQTMEKRPTFVVAFAQDPKLVKMPGVIDAHSGKVPLLYQGVIWIDQETYRIVRIRTDLLAPLPRIQLEQLSSTLSFSEVKIPKFDTPLWLPRHVEITWDVGGYRMGEIHRYSQYGLFQVTSRILPN